MRQTKTFHRLCSVVALIFILILFSPLHAQKYGWVKIAQPTISFPSAIEFVDSLNGWIGVINSDADKAIFRTRDGGRTWQRQIAPLAVNVQSISFVNPLQGWIVGNLGNAFGYIIHTSSGGQVWEEQLNLLHRLYNGIYAQSPLQALTTGGLDSFFTRAGLLVRTGDGGRNWKEERFLAGVGKLEFVDSLHGWASAAEGDSARIVHTVDGGKTWTIQHYDLSQVGFMARIDFVDSLRGWAVGRGRGANTYPVVMGTRNGGATWGKVYKFPFDHTSPDFGDLAFADTLNGWLFGDAIITGGAGQGAIYRTTDGGRSWILELVDERAAVTNGEFLDRSHGWATLADGRVLRYGQITAIHERDLLPPPQHTLWQNYPNPFNPTTTIEYSLTRKSPVTLAVSDLLGKEVRTLVQSVQGPGNYRVEFDASGLAGGHYFYTLKAEGFEKTQSMHLIK